MSHEARILTSIFLLSLFQFCTPTDTKNSTQSLKDGDLLVSSNGSFALGFFSLRNSRNRYLGIWYNKISEQTAVWVANRDHPINNSFGFISLDNTGNLIIHGSNWTGDQVWSTNVSNSGVSKNYSAQLLESGNLKVFDSSRVVVWQSFDFLTHTILPQMKFGVDRKTGLSWFVTSWKSRDNPGIGEYSHSFDLTGLPQTILYKGSNPVWRTGTWIGNGWNGVPETVSKFIFTMNYVDDQDEVSPTYVIRDPSIVSRMVMNESGKLQLLRWDDRNRQWDEFFFAPTDQCDNYNRCGPNGNCDPSHVQCTCLPGFEPKSARNWWDLRDGSGGCVRKRGGGHVCRAGEGFVKVARAKLPNTWTALVNRSMGLKECKGECLRNCTCNAYASADFSQGGEGTGCVTWHGDLLDTMVFPSGGHDLYIRVDAIELDNEIQFRCPHFNVFLIYFQK